MKVVEKKVPSKHAERIAAWLILIIFFLTHHSQPASAEIPFVMADSSRSARLKGFIRQCDTEYAKYFFQTANDEENLEIVIKIDSMLGKVAKFVPNLKIGTVHSKIEIYFAETGSFTPRARKIVLDPEDPFLTGGAIFCATGNQYPAWLCAGLEGYFSEGYDDAEKEDPEQWAMEAIENAIPLFGDEWLIPSYIDFGDIARARRLASSFVEHLDKAGLLQEIISNKTDAETVNAAWAQFTGVDGARMNLSCNYRYGMNDVLFDIDTEKALYHFEKSDWRADKVHEYIFYMDAGIRYVERWFGQDVEKLECTLHTGDASSKMGGQTVTNRSISLFHAEAYPPLEMAHEVVHALSEQMGFALQFMPFSEGLANVIMHRFEEEYKGAFYNSDKRMLKESWWGYAPFEAIEDYNRYSLIPYHPDGEILLNATAHTRAYYALNGGGEPYPFPASLAYLGHEKLSGYDTSSSFVHYLLDKYGKDSMLAVYRDFSRIETVYGVDIDTLVAEWIDYLID